MRRSTTSSSDAAHDRARDARTRLDPQRAAGWQVEPERADSGDIVPVLTIFLVNRECPWRCVFCDLWQHTLERNVAPGDVPLQIERALAEAGRDGTGARHVKLYNAGSFFDPRAIPVDDHPAVAARMAGFERVIVECHPALVGDRVWRFRDALAAAGRGATLEVAMGLETVNPAVLPRLRKGVTLEDYGRACGQLREHSVAIRAFVLVQPPFEAPGEAIEWATRSVEFALESGVTAVTLIPVRPGNGELEALSAAGEFTAPTLDVFESAVTESMAIARGRGRVFADLWDLGRFTRCPTCLPARRARLESMNLHQRPKPALVCAQCGAGA